jgi:hypothetical protein
VLLNSTGMETPVRFGEKNETNFAADDYTVCPTRYRTRHFFNNSNTIENIEMKFEQVYIRCVRNEEECVYSVCL